MNRYQLTVTSEGRGPGMRLVGGPLHGQERPADGDGYYAYPVGADGVVGSEPFAFGADYVEDGLSASFMGCRPEQPEWPLR